MSNKTTAVYVPSSVSKIDWSLVDRKIMDVFNKSDKACLDEKQDKVADFGLAPYEKNLDKIILKKLLCVEEVMIYLGVGDNAARKLLNRPGNSYSVKWGSRVYANRTKLDLYFDQHTGNYQGRSIL